MAVDRTKVRPKPKAKAGATGASTRKTRHKTTAKVTATSASTTWELGQRKKCRAKVAKGVALGDFDIEIDPGSPTVDTVAGKVTFNGTATQANVPLTASCSDENGAPFALNNSANPTPTGALPNCSWSHAFDAPAQQATAVDYLYTVTGSWSSGGGGGLTLTITVSVSVWFTVPAKQGSNSDGWAGVR
jgi:hypothetical protein